jgi:hypothetical protein
LNDCLPAIDVLNHQVWIPARLAAQGVGDDRAALHRSQPHHHLARRDMLDIISVYLKPFSFNSGAWV